MRSLAMLVALLLTACSGVEPRVYEGETPRLDIMEYFDGRVRGWGMFQQRGGEVVRRLTVDIDGRVEQGTLILDESFVYADGETETRQWRIKKIGPHRYEGRAEDIVGVAIGEEYGNAIRWQYTLALPVGDSVYDMQFEDWMYLQPDGVLLNRAFMRKYGIALGEVTLAFKRIE